MTIKQTHLLTVLLAGIFSITLALPALAQTAVQTTPVGTPVQTTPVGTPVQTTPVGTPVQTTPTSGGGGLVNPLNVSTVQALLAEVMQFVVIIGSILLTLMIIYVGFLFVVARGNEEAIKKARTALLWTIIGGLVLLGASAIASVIAATAGAITN